MRPDNVNDKPPPKHRDYRAEVTQDIIRMLEEGTAPWQKPWDAGESGSLPYNPTSGKPYRGGNVIALMVAAMRKGFDDPRWMTYKQSAEKGWQVRKGEKSSFIEFWDAKPGSKAEDAGDDEKRGKLIHRVYSVFNAQQIDGIPKLDIPPRQEWEVCEEGERILKDSGAIVRHGGNRAFYRPLTDDIHLPEKGAFPSAAAYLGTALHELGHWTGHNSRLNRETLTKSKGYDPRDENYAREELCAEISSMMVARETGLPHDPSQHAAYLNSWLDALRKDKNEIFRAASNASKAVDFILGKGQGKAAEPGAHTERVRAEAQERSARYR